MPHTLQAASPDDLALLYEFTNSLDERRFVRNGVAHTGGDALATVADLERWMRDHALLGARTKLDAKSLAAALELRRALRALLEVPPSDRPDDAVVSPLVNHAAAAFPLIVQVSEDGKSRLQPLSGARAGGLGAVLAQLHHASETGRLDRLKMCDDEDCRKVFYDWSKPSTRRWCASAVCGNRQKTRAYRRRQQKG